MMLVNKDLKNWKIIDNFNYEMKSFQVNQAG